MPINPVVLQATNSFTDGAGLVFSRLPGGNYRDVTIGVGDIVTVTVYEAQAGGLFIPREAGVRPGNFVDIPRQQVDQSGNINIPYAGSIKVSGLTPRAVGNIIRERLKDRAIDPQAVVSVAEQRGNQVSVLGEVNTPLRFPVDPGGIRLMGAIARAGGPKYPSYESTITIKRNGRTYNELMSSVVRHPGEDILLAPGDVVFLTRIPRVFMVFGSTPSPGFDRRHQQSPFHLRKRQHDVGRSAGESRRSGRHPRRCQIDLRLSLRTKAAAGEDRTRT